MYAHPAPATEPVSTRLPRDLALRLARLAQDSDRSVCAELRIATREHLERHEAGRLRPVRRSTA
jgi:predicted transcriptional regulator